MERNDTDCKMEIRDYEVSKITYNYLGKMRVFISS